MRGEDGFFGEAGIAAEGSPPHARGRRPPAQRRRRAKRITPACAGKTRRSPPFWGNGQDHPRMRGEDNRLILADLDVVGSPPHARGRRGGGRRGSRLDRDHPRMRGEDDGLFEFDNEPVGSPPHARGRQTSAPLALSGDRITPACAGKTKFKLRVAPLLWDHPRMRGEDS